MITNVYIDGFNMYNGCLKGTPYKWLDVDALVRMLLPHDQVKRIRYFTAKINSRPTNPAVAQPSGDLSQGAADHSTFDGPPWALLVPSGHDAKGKPALRPIGACQGH
jgi:hypothetical protein